MAPRRTGSIPDLGRATGLWRLRLRARSIGEQAAILLYDALSWLLLPVLLPLLGWHPRLRGGLAQRLGCGLPRTLVGGERRPVWFHGASAGDLKALLPLLAHARASGLPVVASCWTRSAAEFLRAQGDPVPLLRAPLDLRWAVGRVLEAVAPRLVVAEGLELWPAWSAACAARGIPCVIVNGRLSPRSLRWYRRFGWLFRPRFADLRLVVAATPGDAERFAAAGVSAERLQLSSSSKYAGLDPAERAERRPPRSGSTTDPPRLVLGSLHLAEARQVLPELPRLLQRWPRLVIEIAPRYVHQTRRLLRLLQRGGVASRRVSQRPPAGPVPRVIVHDTMGALAQTYAGAVAAFVGGSLVPHGGHNLIEPAARGVAVLHGPHVEHCRAEAALLAERGASFMVGDASHFGQTVDRLLADPSLAPQAGRAARRVAEELAAGAERITLLLAPLLDQFATTGSAR